MKFVIILSVLTVVCAIRVPTSWDEVHPRDVTRTPYHPRPKKPYHHVEPTRRYNERPTLNNYRKNQHFYVNKQRVNKPPPIEHQLPKYRKRRPDFKPNDWTPIFPKDYYGPPKKYQQEEISEYNSDDDEEIPHEADEAEETEDEPTHEKDEDTDYEDSQPVVEKYPIRPHRYAKNYYPKKSIKRSDDVDFEEHQDSEHEQQDNEEKDDEDHFVPTQLYTKVRHSEDTEHLPFEGNDRLREVIKESKINTIYTEKGSEDSEYDHGDEEKKGEKGESYAEHKIENEPAPKITVVQSGDSDAAGSETRTVTLIETESRVKREAATDKYPYYTDPSVNKNSPLKYSENLGNIPPKTVDDMAFYNQAQNKRNCSEKLPIELIKSNNKTIANITIDIPNEVPKQGNLGDQIDCFKEIYFGQDPLDSPFFQETTVEPVEDLTVQTEVPTNLETNILTDILGHMNTTDSIDYEDIENDRNGRALELDNENSTDSTLPESQALILRRRKFRPSRPFVNRLPDFKKTYPRKSTYHPYYEEYVPTSTVLPKYKVVSEVFYKDEIKPNEQLNVFADVINNIHNSSHNDDSSPDYSEPIAVKLNVNRYNKAGNKKIKIPSKKIRIKNVLEDSYLDTYEQIQRTNKFTTTTMKPILAHKERPKFTTHRNNEQLYEELVQSLKNNDQNVGESQNTEQFAENAVVHKVKVRRRNSTTTTTPATEEEAEEEDTTKTVLGLLPPEQYNYKTIVKVDHKESEEIPLNKYLVPGMKPPPKQKVYLYSDFMLLPKNKVRRRQDFYYGKRRGKREANKPAYSEHSRNRGRQEDAKVANSDDDDDDYVPHRPKNYHYDEKLGKIVYHNVKKEEVEEDEDYEEVEVVTPKPHRQKTTRKPVVITSPKPGEGFMDYVKLLKSNEKYVMIEETTTTEKPSTTAKPFIVTPSKDGPAFVDLLAKLHSNKEYKVIQNPEDSAKKPKPFTKPEVVDEEEEEEEDEEPPAIIQNSRGGENVYSDPSYQIFDIGDFIPKVKSYMPRTSIDYSKYKTIERPNTRHNLSSRYNSDESLDDVNTSQVPILSEMSKRSDLVDESTEEVVSHRSRPTTTTTTTEKPPEKTTFKLRGRGRQRARTTSTTTTAAPSTHRTSAPRLQHEKPKRNYVRRRPSRIKLRTTTDLNLESEADDTPKIVRRRSQNSQPIYVPDDAEEDTASEELDPTTVKPPPSTTKFVKSAKVEVFKKFNPENKHGGNYRKLEVENQETNQTKVKKIKVNQIKPVERLTDVVAKPYSFYTDPKLPDTINKLKTVEAEEEVDEASTEDVSDYYDDAVQIKFEEEKKETKQDSKPPKIIKDPSKRLYYYAA